MSNLQTSNRSTARRVAAINECAHCGKETVCVTLEYPPYEGSDEKPCCIKCSRSFAVAKVTDPRFNRNQF